LGVHLEVIREVKAKAGADTQIHLAVEADDVRGRLAHVDATTKLDLARAIRTRRLPNDTMVEADFAVETRKFDQMPVSFRPAGLDGAAELHGYLQGTAEKPFLVVEVAGHQLRYARPGRAKGPALEAELVMTYDLEQAAVQVDVSSGKEKVLQASAELNAALREFVAAKGNPPPWKAGLYADIHRFPLGFLPAFSQNGMQGMLSGKISVSGIHDKPAIAGNLTIEELRSGNDQIGTLALAVQVDEHQCAASLDARGPSAASALARVSAGCLWKNDTVPSLDPEKQLDVALDTTAFPLAALGPVLHSAVQRLAGTLDVHLRARGRPDPAATDWSLQGTAQIQQGNMLPLAVGREVRRLDLKMSLGMDGVRIETLSGELGGGKFSAKGAVELRDKALTGGRMELHVPRLRPIPITTEGVSYGNVWGDIYADAKVNGGQLEVTVKAPTLRFELPPQSTANLEKLEDNPAVAVVQPLGPPQNEKAVGGGPSAFSLVPSGVAVSLELGENVGISRDDMKVELQTPRPPANPKLTFNGGMHLTGAIQILGGRVPVAGKTFRIERGTVRFGGDDPSNPALDIYAVYDEGGSSVSRIDVHVGGTPKDIKLALTSTPPKPQNELLAILAFGDSEPGGGLGGPGAATSGGSATSQSGGSQGGGSNSGATAAAGVGSAVLSQGLNQILSQSIIPVRASISGTSSASATVDLTERLRVEYIRQFGTQYGQQQDNNQFAFDWRFKPRWMLRTLVGDKGTTVLDLLWQRWY
jgi:autotransporter translocation and assembly factor TamB